VLHDDVLLIYITVEKTASKSVKVVFKLDLSAIFLIKIRK